MREITTTGPGETRAFASHIGEGLRPGDLVALDGELGAGKTTFVQGLAAGWGSTDRVTSPTFVLVNEYRRPDGGRLYHVDAYRLTGPAEAADLDLDSLLAVGPMVVEWAGRILPALPPPSLSIRIEDLGADRRLVVVLSDSSDSSDAQDDFDEKDE